MNLTSRLSDSLDRDLPARAFLGDDHPLARACEWRSALLKQSLVIAALGTVSAIALAEGVPGALAVLAAVVAVGVAIAVTAAALRQRSRAYARDLIAAGGEDLPIAAVRRERCRLRDPGYRSELARWLEAIGEEAEHRVARPPYARPLFSVRVIATVQPRLAEIAIALRGVDPGVRGVLGAQRLLERGASPLYGDDADALRRELQLIRILLERCGERHPSPADRQTAGAKNPSAPRGCAHQRR